MKIKPKINSAVSYNLQHDYPLTLKVDIVGPELSPSLDVQTTSQGDVQFIVFFGSSHETEQPSIQNSDAVHHKVIPAGPWVVKTSGGIHSEASVQWDVECCHTAEKSPVQCDAAVTQVCVVGKVHCGILHKNWSKHTVSNNFNLNCLMNWKFQTWNQNFLF